ELEDTTSIPPPPWKPPAPGARSGHHRDGHRHVDPDASQHGDGRFRDVSHRVYPRHELHTGGGARRCRPPCRRCGCLHLGQSDPALFRIHRGDCSVRVHHRQFRRAGHGHDQRDVRVEGSCSGGEPVHARECLPRYEPSDGALDDAPGRPAAM
ncbi:MAG: hypothetical protein AVDCRST_MAG87-1609, partial [uncultured Thermomicrobiales bacterium]